MTDANLVLGFLPEKLAGGSVALDVAAARAAIEREVARPLGLDVEAAALGIRAVVNADMARAIRAVTVERGVDPRDFTLLAFGGSGPNHACDLARMLDIRQVLFPPAPGVFTALGMLSGAIEHFFIRAFPGTLGALDRAALRHATEAMAAEARNELEAEGLDPAAAASTSTSTCASRDRIRNCSIDFDPARSDEGLGGPARAVSRALPRDLRLCLRRSHRGGEPPPDRSPPPPGKAPPRPAPVRATRRPHRRPEPFSSRPIRFARDEDRRQTPVFLRDDFAGSVDRTLCHRERGYHDHRAARHPCRGRCGGQHPGAARWLRPATPSPPPASTR